MKLSAIIHDARELLARVPADSDAAKLARDAIKRARRGFRGDTEAAENLYFEAASCWQGALTARRAALREQRQSRERLDNPQPYTVHVRLRIFGRESAPLIKFARLDEAEDFARRQPPGRVRRWAAKLWPQFRHKWREDTQLLCMIVRHPVRLSKALTFKHDRPRRHRELAVHVTLPESRRRHKYRYSTEDRAEAARQGHAARALRELRQAHSALLAANQKRLKTRENIASAP